MKENNIHSILNVAYRFEYNPCERMWSLIKHNYRQLLLDKMLQGAGVKSQPLKAALHEALVMTEVNKHIPKYIKKAMGMLRRDANHIRKQND